MADAERQRSPSGATLRSRCGGRAALAKTRELAGRANQLFAALLAHLAEVDARGLHRTKACASLYTYCIYELRFSEDAAARRAGAAKLVKRFPLLLQAIAHGEIHLTGLLMLGPHLTPENLVDVLGRAKFRTKKKLARLIRELRPLPLVPDLIELLRPEPSALRKPSCEEYAASLAPAVRELPPGERPKDWANDARDARDASETSGYSLGSASGSAFEQLTSSHVSAESLLPAPARVNSLREELPPITGPQQYQVQFSTTEEHVQLIERAKALLARNTPGKSLGELHLEAMRLLVASLEKKKFAMTEHPRRTSKVRASSKQSSLGAEPSHPPPKFSVCEASEETAMDAVEDECASATRPADGCNGRHIPAAVRRAVYERDGARCAYVDARGTRCQETRFLELHHRQPFGKRGAHTTANLTVHCRAHNALAAEQDFGRAHMADSQESGCHSSPASEQREAQRTTGPG